MIASAFPVIARERPQIGSNCIEDLFRGNLPQIKPSPRRSASAGPACIGCASQPLMAGLRDQPIFRGSVARQLIQCWAAFFMATHFLMHASTVGEGVPRGISPHVMARHTHLKVEHLALAGVSDAEKARASIPPTINRRMVSSSPLAYGARSAPQKQ
jgi:hypothetical protein